MACYENINFFLTPIFDFHTMNINYDVGLKSPMDMLQRRGFYQALFWEAKSRREFNKIRNVSLASDIENSTDMLIRRHEILMTG